METAVTHFLVLSTQLFNGQTISPAEDYVFTATAEKPTFVPRLNTAEVLKDAAFESKDAVNDVLDALCFAENKVKFEKEGKEIEIKLGPNILTDFLNIFTERCNYTIQLSSVTITVQFEEGKQPKVHTQVNKTKRVSLGFRVY